MATATETKPEKTEQLKPLWPANLKIEVVGLTGEYASGKTLFALTIDPARTLCFDTEKSAGTYEGLGFTRVDLSKLSHLKPLQLFEQWHAAVKRIQPGQYRVIVLDTVSEIESGLADWVAEHPAEFGHTKNQYDKMEGLFWGDVKEHWKRVLSDLASRCECFVFTAHLRNVWSGNKPTGQRAPKGKETLMELASLYLKLERKPDEKGRVPDKPSARVLKSRLARTSFDAATGEVQTQPILPPHLPEATPTAIRRYIEKPADYSHLKKGELLPEERMSDDERLAMQTTKAEAERDTEEAKLRRMELMRLAGAEQQAGLAKAAQPATAPASQPVSQLVAQPANDNGHITHPGKASVTQQSMLVALKQELGMSLDQFNAILARRDAKQPGDLTHEQAAFIIEKLKEERLKNSHGRK